MRVSLPCISLPFKGRDGVGMGLLFPRHHKSMTRPPLDLPLEGGGTRLLFLTISRNGKDKIFLLTSNLLYFLDEFGRHLVEIADDTQIRRQKDRGVGVPVHGADQPGAPQARQVLDLSGNAQT